MSVSAILASAAIAQTGSSTQQYANTQLKKLEEGSLTKAMRIIKDHWTGGAGQTIVSRSKELQTEPIVLLDERVTRYPYVADILETCQRMYSTYYLLSIAADVTIEGVTLGNRLSKYSADPSLLRASANYLSVEGYSPESYQFGLPFTGEKLGLERYTDYTVESCTPQYSPESDAGGNNLLKQATDIYSLSVGQVVNVTIGDSAGNKGTFPVLVKLRVVGASPESIVSNFKLGMGATSNPTRRLQLKIGQITAKDAITNQDRIDEYRRARFSDKSGFFKATRDRANKGLLSTLLTGESTIGSVSSMAVLDSRTVRTLEDDTYRSIDDYSARQKLFEKSLLIFLVVVDDAAEIVTVYLRDTEKGQTYPLSDLRKKGKGNDLTDLLKSFLNGQLPGRM